MLDIKPTRLQRHLTLITLAGLCTACATGGGSFDRQALPSPIVINTWDTGPSEQDHVLEGVLQPPPSAHPEYGFTAAEPYIIRTSNAAQPVDPDRATADQDDQFDTTLYHRHPDTVSDTHPASERISINPETWRARPGIEDYTRYLEGDNDGQYLLLADAGNVLKTATFTYTRLGMVQLAPENRYDPSLSNIFYKGSLRPEAIPVSGRATYEGYWERALATLANDYVNGYRGNTLTVSKASFEVDFSTRKLSGTLDGRNGERRQGYTIQADITGADFLGVATPLEYSNVQEDAVLSGSFFGPQAAELAGRLVGIHRNAVGVFAARQTSASNIIEGEASSLAIGLHADTSATEAPASVFQDARTLAYSGNIHVLRFNGTDIDLRQLSTDQGLSCCVAPQFQFIQIGALPVDSDEEKSEKVMYFTQGTLTPLADMPASGQASYRGRWLAFGRAPKGQAYIASTEHTARFTADFDARTLTGALQGPSGADLIDVRANIQGNRFSGTTHILSRLSSDSQGINIASDAVIRGSGQLSGAFHGPGANELAGHFINEDKRLGGVFGAKQRVPLKTVAEGRHP